MTELEWARSRFKEAVDRSIETLLKQEDPEAGLMLDIKTLQIYTSACEVAVRMMLLTLDDHRELKMPEGLV